MINARSKRTQYVIIYSRDYYKMYILKGALQLFIGWSFRFNWNGWGYGRRKVDHHRLYLNSRIRIVYMTLAIENYGGAGPDLKSILFQLTFLCVGRYSTLTCGQSGTKQLFVHGQDTFTFTYVLIKYYFHKIYIYSFTYLIFIYLPWLINPTFLPILYSKRQVTINIK